MIKDNNFIKRIDADEGTINDTNWQLSKVNIISSYNKKTSERLF